MKKLLLLFTAALLLSAGVCSAQTPTPKQKACVFVEQIFAAVNDNDFGRLETIGKNMGNYIGGLTEGQAEEFGEEFATKVYECSDKYGYGKEFADEFLRAMVGAMTGEGEAETESGNYN